MVNLGGVRFVVCELTKAGMERSEGRQISLIENVDILPSGPARFIELEEAGWSYLRNGVSAMSQTIDGRRFLREPRRY